MNKDFLTAGELRPTGFHIPLWPVLYSRTRPLCHPLPSQPPMPPSQTYPLNPQQPLRLIQVVNRAIGGFDDFPSKR
jgi:hypothetical protein